MPPTKRVTTKWIQLGPCIFKGTSIDTRSTLDRHATDMSTHCRPRVNRCFGRASTDVGRRIDRDHIGRLSVNYRRDIGQLWANMSTETMVPIDISADTMGHNKSKTPNKIRYSYRVNTNDRCIEKYMDRCPDRYIDLCLDRYTRGSIGTLLVKYR